MPALTLMKTSHAIKKKLEAPPEARVVKSRADLAKLKQSDLLWVQERAEDNRRMVIRKLKAKQQRAIYDLIIKWQYMLFKEYQLQLKE